MVEERVSKHPLELKKGNYVVVGVFKFIKNAEIYKKKLENFGHSSVIGFSSKTGFFYLYITSHKDFEDAKDRKNSVRENELFNNAWVMTVQ